jgi:sulfite exporter TauE/SafE
MGVVVAAMGAVITRDSRPMGALQIVLGAVLVWIGVQREIRDAAAKLPAPPLAKKADSK